MRLFIGGRADIDGTVTADGADGLQDDSGGGSGGSVWPTASAIIGNGTIAADGGAGELYGGGGGGGGRIAIYCPANNFAGQVSAVGGPGAFSGGTGTVYLASALPGLQVVSQTPQGSVSNTVGQVNVQFSGALNAASLAVSNLAFSTPNGPLSSSSLSTAPVGPAGLLAAFPTQNTQGDYRIELSTNITDIFGTPLSQVYTGAFAMVIPVISGTVVDSNGAAVPGVTLQQTGGAALSALSDANGAYSLGVDPGWTGSIVPSLGALYFVPHERDYTNVTGSISGQNYLAVTSLAANLNSGLNSTGFFMNWFGISGVTYQTQYLTNLVDWLPYGGPLVGTNGPAEIIVPTDSGPQMFFRMKASN